MPRLSTQLKVASGYILLTLLLFASIQYINHEMKALTETDDNETILNLRRRVTNEIVGQLYQAEIIGQSLSANWDNTSVTRHPCKRRTLQLIHCEAC